MAFGRAKPRLRAYSPENVKGGKNRLRSMTAAGTRMTRATSEDQRRVRQPWQSQAFAYYDKLGEIKYAAQFYSRALSKLRLYAAEEDEQGEIVETENEEAIKLLQRVKDPGGGRSQMLSQYGRLMFLAGETNLFVSKDPETEQERWEFLSTFELLVEPGDPPRYRRLRAQGLSAEEYRDPGDDDYEPVGDKQAVVYRIWRPHPLYSGLADSTMQGVLDVCEELKLLEQVIRARAKSRIAGAGILFMPDNVGPPPLEVVPGEDPDEDPFIADLTEAMTAPIADEGSASSVVPMVIRGDADALEKVRHLQLVDPTQLYPETGLRMELIKRLAIGLDLPPEILLGLQDSNHWSAWQVDEQTWKAHLQPIAQYLVDDLTSAYYQPTLRQENVEDWQKYRIAYDAAEVINHPDRTKDAKDLHDRAVLSDEALREASGFDDDDAPSEQEVNRRIGILVRDPSLALYGIPSIRGGSIEPEPGEVVSANGSGGSPETVKEAPPGGAEAAVPGDVVGSAAEVAKIMGAADLAVRRAREAAGNRLRSFAKRDPEALKLIESLPAGQVAHALGPDLAEKLKAPAASELVAGATGLFAEALAQWGIEDAEFLGEQIERHAARTLFEQKPSPLPPAIANYLLEKQKS